MNNTELLETESYAVEIQQPIMAAICIANGFLQRLTLEADVRFITATVTIGKELGEVLSVSVDGRVSLGRDREIGLAMRFPLGKMSDDSHTYFGGDVSFDFEGAQQPFSVRFHDGLPDFCCSKEINERHHMNVLKWLGIGLPPSYDLMQRAWIQEFLGKFSH